MLPVLISQKMDSVDSEHPIATTLNLIDEGNSRIKGSSMVASYVEGFDLTRPKDSDDKTVIGYTAQGLPFLIAVDGFFNRDTPAVFKFVDNWIVPLMDDYAHKFKICLNVTMVLQELISSIYELRRLHAPSAAFALSIAIFYEKKSQIWGVGFGIGRPGLALRRNQTKEIEQLVYSTQTDGFKDAFDEETEKRNLQKVIARNSIFHVTAQPDDELVGYTYVFGLEQFYNEKPLPPGVMVKCKLDPEKFSHDKSLYDQIVVESRKRFLQACQAIKKQRKSKSFGDDSMVSAVILPQLDLQHRLQLHIYETVRERAKEKIKSLPRGKVREFACRIYKKVQQIKNSSPREIPILSRVLSATIKLLNHPSPKQVAEYRALADYVIGAPCAKMKILGGLILVLGALLLVVGVLSLVGTLGLSLAASTGLIAGGSAAMLKGIGLFSLGGRKKLSQEMEKMAALFV